MEYEEGKSVYLVACGNTVGESVRIVQNNHHLTLCEVQVLGVPSDDQPLRNIAPGLYN